ncbi:coproporphyrinogen III oxidase, anaerobic [Rhodopseudomonas palustris HaA2]|uniref:Coproporphyrinogen III oxidase, anaerobic n=1 Tax=Rhodopseudomonas palustris (strain HaA2) TaxID=316058 RepID=Q2J3T4_RHOP2|nr:heme anaerobic degradation radical SAM methyltransferase ChuW/HutW [Rhodopseudomonas palustris]ABD04876.1 coproporphyrinogen III oxidase, anaerobic [Rhodopseudomonas palustris HaA2]
MTMARATTSGGAPHGGHGHHPAAAAALQISDYFVRIGCDALTEAFAKRSFSPPWRGSRPVDGDDVEAVLARIFATLRNETAVAYVHVPFCQTHCLFCGFFQNVWRAEAGPAYVDDVLAELAARSSTPLIASAPIDAVYLGGGTPSALAADDLARLVEGLRRYLPLTSDCEITLEGRGFGFDLAKAEKVADAGVTRLSIGVQTFSTQVRRRLGRKLAGPEVQSFLADLVALGRTAVVCDLIYGLPGQTDDIWANDIEIVDRLGLDGVTLYALNMFPGGPMARAIENGKLAPPAAPGVQARVYAEAVERLAGRGWLQVSQSHLVRSAREFNRYNAAIKRGVACLPFGAGAGGQAHGYRWRNVIDIAQRRDMIAQQRAPVEGLAQVPADHAAHAMIAAGLEAGRLDLAAIEALRPGFRAAVAPLLANWAAGGLGELSHDGFRPNRAGSFWISNLTSGLSAGLQSATQAATSGCCASA